MSDDPMHDLRHAPYILDGTCLACKVQQAYMAKLDRQLLEGSPGLKSGQSRGGPESTDQASTASTTQGESDG